MQKASKIIQLLNKNPKRTAPPSKKPERNSTSKARSLTQKTTNKEIGKDFLV